MAGLRLAAITLLLLSGVAWLIEPGFWTAVKLFAVAWLVIEAAEFARVVRSHRPLPKDAPRE